MRNYFLGFVVLFFFSMTLQETQARFKTYNRLTCQMPERYFFALTQDAAKGYENCLEAGYRLVESNNTDLKKEVQTLYKKYGVYFEGLYEVQQWEMVGKSYHKNDKAKNPMNRNFYAAAMAKIPAQERVGLLRGVLLAMKDYDPESSYITGVLKNTLKNHAPAASQAIQEHEANEKKMDKTSQKHQLKSSNIGRFKKRIAKYKAKQEEIRKTLGMEDTKAPNVNLMF